jgi:ABC-type protease/lipase transport system fused ATPase/permease subunit
MNDDGNRGSRETGKIKRDFGFWELLILSTLITAFFPWSLLFLVLCYGLEQTIIVIKALLSDILITLIGIVIGAAGLILLLGFLLTKLIS